MWSLQGGTVTASNDDLNADKYKAIGNYYSDENAKSKTILHNPYADAASTSCLSFTLKTQASLGTGTQYLRQTWIAYNSGVEAERTSTNSGSSWSEWRTKVFKNSNASTKEGDADRPVYIAANGQATAITTLSTAYGGTGNTSFTQWGVIYANPATKLVSTAAGTAGYPLIGSGSAAPAWYGGQVNSGTAAVSWITAFKGTTASTSTTTGAVTIAGGLGVAGQVTATRIGAGGSNTSYALYVNGTSYHKGLDTHEGNIVPSASNTYTLGTTSLRWQHYYGSQSIDLEYAGETGLEVNNTSKTHKTAFIVGSSGNGGVYDRTHSFWVLATDQTNGDTWLKSKALRNIIFERNGTENARFNTSGHFIPGADSTFTIGDTTKHWLSAHIDEIYISNDINFKYASSAFAGNGLFANKQDIRIYQADNIISARLYLDTLGTTSAQGYARLTLGNTKRYVSASKEANNSRGRILMYESGDNYSYYYPSGWYAYKGTNDAGVNTFTICATTSATANEIALTYLNIGNSTASSATGNNEGILGLYSANTNRHLIRGLSTTSNRWHYLPESTGWIVTGGSPGTITAAGAAGADATGVGSTTQPIYLKANGVLDVTSYYLKANISAGTANQVAYYSDATTIASKAPAWGDWTAGTTAGPKANIQIGNATYTSPVIPSASTSASGIVTTGDQRFKGTKGFGYLSLYGDENGTAKQYSAIKILNNAGTQVGSLFYDFGNTTNVSSGQWNLRQYSPNTTANTTTTGKYETFNLPAVTAGLSANVTYNILTTKNPPVVWVATAAATAAKVGTTAYYTLANNRYLHVILTTTSTVKSALTLNINGAGAKPIYLNGSATSSSNYSIPAGHYQVYYDGTNYYFNTNEYLPVGSIAPGPTNVNVVGNSSHYFRGAYINGFGNIHWGNLYAVNVGGNTDPVITADRLRGLNRVVAGGGADYYRPTNALFGVRNSSVTIEITTDGGSTWTTKTGLDTRGFFNENTMTITPGLNAAGTAFDQYDATNANSTTGGGSGVTYAAGFWANKGIRITIDMLPEGRTGTLDMLILRFGTAGSSSTNKSHYKIERLNYTKDLNTPTDWVTIHESASTSWNSNDRLQTIYPPQFYLSGTSSSSTASYARYLRITFIVDDWATAYRYAPRLIAFAGFTSAGALNTANARTGSEFARAMVTFGGPYIIEDRNTGALGFDSDLLPRSRTTEGSAIVTNNVHNIGASNRRWATVYATTFDGAATQVKATSSNTKAYILGGSSYSGNVTVYSNSNVYMQSGVLYGAAWNDYAEFRQSKDNIPIEPGRVVKELGDDTLELANARLQRGCEIVSDTYGFAIGQTEKANLPIATTGRVLAYPYESLNDFKECIGWAVCSGPNGTVSIMTEDEERNYPSRIIGYVSAVPDYEIWYGEKEIEVNGRVWIRVR